MFSQKNPCDKFRKFKNMKTKIAIAGLGKMGSQVAKKLFDDKYSVIAYNRSRGKVDDMKNIGMTPAYSKKEVVSLFGGECVIIWVMIPSDTVDKELEEWLKIIPKGSILIY